MAAEAVAVGGLGLEHAVALLATAVVAAPLFRRLGLGSVLGYLAAGLVIGPFGLGIFRDPENILHVAEFGVVMFLFIIGLEMRPAKLWALRKEIFGLGAAQATTAIVLLSFVGIAAGLPWAAAAIGASGFVLSSTAVIMKMMDEAGETSSEAGQRNVSILLFEDLMIVPLLAAVAIIAGVTIGVQADAPPLWQTIALGVGAIALVFLAGRFVLNPLFGVLARSGAREVMTAAALLVVLGSALLMDIGGLSMAMGAFLAGVLLSDSVFRHQLEADVEPFRGILLALFFISVGMSLNVTVVLADWQLIAAGVVAFMAVKALGIYGVARVFKADQREAVRRAALFAQGGEFAFVLYAAALSAGVMDARIAAVMTAIVIISMALTPLVVLALNRLTPPQKVSLDGVEKARDLRGQVLFIGFGRFAQVVSQSLLARGVDISLIETDVEMIRVAANFGFKVYYGDGTRLDVLRASGAGTAEAILICVDKPETTDHIVSLVKSEFPHAKIFARSYDRGHSMRLVKAGVEYQLRELFESSLTFSGAVLRDLGFSDLEIAETIEDVRERDAERFEMQLAGGIEAGRGLWRNNTTTPQPTPFTKPRQEGRALNEEAAEVLEEADEAN
ncbi:monovalent cation:proton antiporter-2 (CPA2) family protein [Candidatus Viadribacter manganicus]|uniref:Potassium transporter n=1 Tax=Candidatus Viadribacter manganicus TaxID=1759059 RepID=A0A1B1AG20_9PROT|nr:monovalent cation:proton antiporter-2 (CPA2) family protein [Candidatus Viadribacter manganicus]ANP45509.1 potassium transporter [Candidatus Viadribacter manganicus]